MSHSNKAAQENTVNLQQVQASSNQSNNNDIGSSWATTISHYLLQRRAQTHIAYQAQLQLNAMDFGSNETQNWLFEAIFEVLVQRLDEGHTVLVLDAAKRNILDIESNIGSDTGLFAWQQQLLQPLLQSLLIHEEDLVETASGVELLVEEKRWKATLLQSSLSKYEQQVLEQRYLTCVRLYQCLQDLAKNSTSLQNSLSKLIEVLNKSDLIKNSISENKYQPDSPIIFQVENAPENSDDASEKTSITLWLHRTWQAEYALAQHIIRIKGQTVSTLPIILNPLLNIEQQEAIHMANRSAFSIITGGPGTGKTFTVAQLVIALQQAQSEEKMMDSFGRANLALAAPTGKAAQRMQESLQDALQQAGVSMQLPEAKTIHRLLGIGQGGRPRYNSDNPLSEDIIIIDEASMLGVELANHLVSAIKANARLILLGDANQLAAVDAGAVLADLCRISALQDVHQRLEMSRRFSAESGIGKLARLINQDKKDMVAVWNLLRDDDKLSFYQLINTASDHMSIDNNVVENSLSNYKFLKRIREKYSNYINQTKNILKQIKSAKYVEKTEYTTYFNQLMTIIGEFKILTAGHHGRCGDHYINYYLSEQHKSELKLPLSKSPWYHGRPIMILQNNYELGLFNGDIGICLQTNESRLQVFFENKTQGIAVNMLSDEMTATAYAMTIHKSQGSEFEHVAISFDDQNARLLSQELIYTAVTRAKKQVSIFSTTSAFTRALSTPTIRQTGLGLQFSRFDLQAKP